MALMDESRPATPVAYELFASWAAEHPDQIPEGMSRLTGAYVNRDYAGRVWLHVTFEQEGRVQELAVLRPAMVGSLVRMLKAVGRPHVATWPSIFYGLS